MSDETKQDALPDDVEHPEKPLERPTTDTKLISDMVVTDAAAAIRDALDPSEEGADDAAAGTATVLHDRLGSVEERLDRLADLEDRFSRIEKAIEDLRSKLDEEPE